MYRPTALAPNLPGGCGHPPLRGWEVLPRNLARPMLLGVPSTPAACGRHPLQAGEGGGFPHPALRWGRGGTRSDLAPPHTRQGFALPPSPGRGFFPSSGPAGSGKNASLRLISGHLQVQVPVLPGGIFPGYVLVHVPLDNFVPAVAVGEVEGLGPVDGIQQEAWAFARAVSVFYFSTIALKSFRLLYSIRDKSNHISYTCLPLEKIML